MFVSLCGRTSSSIQASDTWDLSSSPRARARLVMNISRHVSRELKYSAAKKKKNRLYSLLVVRYDDDAVVVCVDGVFIERHHTRTAKCVS